MSWACYIIQRCYTFNMYISFRIFSRNWTISAGVNSWAGNSVGLLEWQESRLWWIFWRKIAESCARILSVLTFVLNIEYCIQKHSLGSGIWLELKVLCVIFYGLNVIQTRQLNFLFSDWLFSKCAECIENVHCTPCFVLRPDWGVFGA